MSGMEDLVIAGGTEMMSYTASTRRSEGAAAAWMRAMLHLREAASAVASGRLRRRHRHDGRHFAPRDVDELAVESQRRADIAIKEGRFDKSLVPVYHDDGTLALDHEEFPRPQTTLEGLAAPEAVLRGDGRRAAGRERHDLSRADPAGLSRPRRSSTSITPAIRRAWSTAPARVLLASPDYAKKHGLKPRARVVAMANMGDCPTLMLNAPVPAARKVLAKAGLTLDDIDLFEINEAFAVVAEKFIRDLKLDRDKVNVNGGAMALGHPIGATGSILIGTMLDELERRDLKRGLVTMCAAGGMAPAIIIERV